MNDRPLDNGVTLEMESYSLEPDKLYDVRDPTTNQLLFRYCPKTQIIEIKPKNGPLRIISLKPYHR